MGQITRLPQEVYEKIAAGEVIDGPYSVVRELLDNALDAGADEIIVTVNDGGKSLISVRDNGSGMAGEDALLAVGRHTTSKIRTMEDLDTLASMGFRGEALSSICAVSDFTLTTRKVGEGHGTKIVSNPGSPPRSAPAASNPGTTVSVKNLFTTLPARKKFLKSNRAELMKIKAEVVKKAIGFHERGFRYTADERPVLNLKPAQNRAERIDGLFPGTGDDLVLINREEEGFKLDLFLSRRTMPNRSGQYLFVNNRPVVDRSILYTINSPCRGIAPAGRFFFVFMFITIDSALIDVNVHPSKNEIKLQPSSRVNAALHSAVREALSGVKLARVPYKSPDAGSVPGPDLLVPRAVEERSAVYYGESPEFGERAAALETGSGTTAGGIPSVDRLYYRGCFYHTYLLFEEENSILIVDQHAAHERILFENMQASSGDGVLVKRLLVPLNFTPPADRYGEMAENIDAFREAGIEIEPFGDESFNVVTVPAYVPEKREEEIVSLFFDRFYREGVPARAGDLRAFFLETAACRSAVKEGDVLGEEEALSLVDDLFDCNVPHLCPHGRPTFVRYTKAYIEKVFKRR